MSQNDTYWSELISRLDADIRKGERSLVVSELNSLTVVNIPREYKADIADLARRASDPLLALKVLNRVVRAPVASEKPASVKERIVYASALPILGLNEEALEILSKIESDKEPEVLLYSSFAHFGMWNYPKAIPLLKKYIQAKDLSSYMRLVGSVNLIAAYVSSFDFERAQSLIAEAAPAIKKGSHWLLYGNILELEAQIYINEKQYSKALTILDQAEKVLRESGGLYYELIKKWQWVCRLMMSPPSAKLVEEVGKFQQKMEKQHYWEIVRDCELYLGLATNDEVRIINTVLGTPYASFRNRAENLWGRKISLPHKYNRPLDGSSTSSIAKSIYDSRDPQLLFRPTHSVALELLGKDFFKPLSLGHFFRGLYPGEFFNPFTSPKRVMNTVYRLRKRMKELNWSILIKTDQSDFYLKGQGQLTLYRRGFNKELILLDSFHSQLQSRTFTSQDLSEFLNCSKRYAQQVLQVGVSRKVLKIDGNARARVYQFHNHRD